MWQGLHDPVGRPGHLRRHLNTKSCHTRRWERDPKAVRQQGHASGPEVVKFADVMSVRVKVTFQRKTILMHRSSTCHDVDPVVIENHVGRDGKPRMWCGVEARELGGGCECRSVSVRFVV